MHARPTPNPDHAPDSATPPGTPRPGPHRPRSADERVAALAAAPYLYPHPDPVDGGPPGTWPETPYLLLLQEATDSAAEAERVLASDPDAAWATGLMRRAEWAQVYAAHVIRALVPDPDTEIPFSEEDRPEEAEEAVRLGAPARRAAQEPDRYGAAYLDRVRELRREVEAHGAAAEDAVAAGGPRAPREHADERPRGAGGIPVLLPGPVRRARARPSSRAATALTGLLLVPAGLSALSQPYATVHLAIVCGAAVGAFIVWSNLRYDPGTSRLYLAGVALVGLLVGGALADYLHGALALLFAQLAPQASDAAPGDVVTAGLYGLAALVCWVLAATGAGGLHPRAEQAPP